MDTVEIPIEEVWEAICEILTLASEVKSLAVLAIPVTLPVTLPINPPEKVETPCFLAGICYIIKEDTGSNLADILTKSLPKQQRVYLRERIMVNAKLKDLK